MPHVLRSTPLVRSQIRWGRCNVLFDSKLLRVVNVREGKDITKNIFRKVNLRFVAVCFDLNSSISLPWNLQTLILGGYEMIKIAPHEIWEMTQLRHLRCYDVYLPPPPPPRDEFDEANGTVLRNLQTLERVVNLRLSDEVCKRIPNIKGLRMEYNGYLKECEETWSSYCPHNLGRLHKLESLHCVIAMQGQKWHEFAHALTFPNSLKKLSLIGVHLDWEEITIKIGFLTFLEDLHLAYAESGAEWNPVEGGFPRLRSLHINSCYDLRNWNAERSHFPVLEHLRLYDVRKLDELGCGIGEIPTLQSIHLCVCSEALGISAVRIVVEQENNGNATLQLHVQFLNKEKVERFNKTMQEEGLTTNNLHLSASFVL